MDAVSTIRAHLPWSLRSMPRFEVMALGRTEDAGRHQSPRPRLGYKIGTKKAEQFIFDSSSSFSLYIQLIMKSYWFSLQNNFVILLLLLLILITIVLCQVPCMVSMLPIWPLSSFSPIATRVFFLKHKSDPTTSQFILLQ